MIFEETYLLADGHRIPKLGLGTWMIENENAAETVRQAVKIGYRNFDTAQAYGNEEGVGEGIRTCGIPRESLFVGSKVAAECKTYEEAAASIDETLNKMNLSYLNMMLIHSPQPWIEVNQSDNRYEKENREVWRALEDAVYDGKIRSIGVSNFTEHDLDHILSHCRIQPAVNQLLVHISNTPSALMSYCKQHDILVEAYSPVGHGEMLKNQVVSEIAARYHVSIPQLCIQYTIQLGTVSLPKTANPEHMKTNAQLDFVISEDDMNTLLNMERIKDYGESSIFPVYGGKL